MLSLNSAWLICGQKWLASNPMSTPYIDPNASHSVGFSTVSDNSGGLEASHLFSGPGKLLYNLNAQTKDASTYYIWVLDSYTACTPGTQAVNTVNTNTEQISLTGAQPTWTTGTKCRFTTTGGLPAPLAPNTDYWLILQNGVTYSVATSLANALAGTAINFSTAGSGTLTVNVQTTPIQYLKIGQDTIVPMTYPAGRWFKDGIYVVASSTVPGTFTAASANCLFDIVRSP